MYRGSVIQRLTSKAVFCARRCTHHRRKQISNTLQQYGFNLKDHFMKSWSQDQRCVDAHKFASFFEHLRTETKLHLVVDTDIRRI